MDAANPPTIPPVADGQGGNPPLENVPPANESGDTATAVDAGKLAYEHGGQPGESGADITKRREKIRKWKSRHPGQTHPEEHLLPPVGQRRTVTARPVVRKEPPPIPSMASAPVVEIQAADLSLGGGGDPEIAAVLDWTPAEVAEITDELVSGLEDWDKLSDVKAAKLAKLGPALIAQIEADATMPKITKKILLKFLPKLIARKLNEANVNPVKSDGALVTLGLVIYGWDKFSRRRFIATEAKRNAAPVTAQDKP